MQGEYSARGGQCLCLRHDAIMARNGCKASILQGGQCPCLRHHGIMARNGCKASILQGGVSVRVFDMMPPWLEMDARRVFCKGRTGSLRVFYIFDAGLRASTQSSSCVKDRPSISCPIMSFYRLHLSQQINPGQQHTLLSKELEGLLIFSLSSVYILNLLLHP